MAQISNETLLEAIDWSVTRSSGAGGQHVNKTNSAVVAKLDLYLLKVTDEKKSLLFKNLANRLAQGRFVIVRSEEQRDQKSNKDKALEILSRIIEQALYVPKKRVKTKPTKSSIKKRLETKSKKSEIKKIRREKF